ncbi:hypothetical protein SBY92_002512 [Candida maltosa Xu316]|uniref:Ubiquitin-like protein, putative n=1 Tax=Candida maltosa (strain Xu316) TaxID=1245528 RepID=M3JVA1_CANMX|nr:Ubiquitin-like protein, putative [Candida maltosa Xu316]
MSTAIANISTEKSFIDTYQQLMQLSKNESLDKFNSTQDYNNLESLGPSLPKFTYKFPVGTSQSTSESTINLKFKSIKPPFKFQTELVNVSTGSTIYKVKVKLIESLDVLNTAGVDVKDLKFMVKSKVVQDSTVLSTLIPENEEELSFNCMVSAPTKKQEPTETDPESEVFTISNNSWDKIYDIILQDIQDPTKAKELLAKFKQYV